MVLGYVSLFARKKDDSAVQLTHGNLMDRFQATNDECTIIYKYFDN